MSVNIFGLGATSSPGVDKRYVDQKFTTLSTNLATKVNKSGDTVCGNLKILLSGDHERSLGVSDIKAGKSVELLLGNVNNQLRYNCGYPLKICSEFGTIFVGPAGESCRMGAQSDARARFSKDIIMNNNFITDLHDPAVDQDATTKRYVDRRCVKNSVGFVPNLISNQGYGFIVSASTEITQFTAACNVFNSTGEWVSEVNENFWIQIRCPEAVRIHKFAIKGVQTGTIRDWKLQASNDTPPRVSRLEVADFRSGTSGWATRSGPEPNARADTGWNDLFNNGASIDQSFNIFHTDSLIKYSTYRIFISNADGELPGICHWQLYTVDELV